MFEITHQEAQRLLQSAADQTLGADDKSALDAHLATCQACSNYANNLTALEADLRRVLHAQLDNQYPNLDLQAITSPATHFTWTSLFSPTHAMGKATIIATLLLGYFIISNLFGGQLSISESKTPTIIPTPNDSTLVFTTSPTPSSPSTLIGLTTQGCENIIYVIQVDDTLKEIALQFGVPKEIIVEQNNLKLEELSPGKELSIPVCNHTPSHTASTLDHTTTITPLIETVLPNAAGINLKISLHDCLPEK